LAKQDSFSFMYQGEKEKVIALHDITVLDLQRTPKYRTGVLTTNGKCLGTVPIYQTSLIINVKCDLLVTYHFNTEKSNHNG
jgi:hypothetical protein